MPQLLIRIDDRLIHGQVIVAWCPVLSPDRILLCDDEIAEIPWERDIFERAAGDIQVSICTVVETIDFLQRPEITHEKIFLIAESPATIVRLLQGGAEIREVVVGGMHYDEGKRKVADYIYVTPKDIESFRVLHQNHVKLCGQNIPNCKAIDLSSCLKFS